jgi:hypothetical protein
MSPTTAGNPTRQQLDELDALLQRMLALPLNPADEPEPPAPQPAHYRTPAPEPAYRTAPAPALGTNGWRSPALMFTADSMSMAPPPPPPPAPPPPPPPVPRPAPPPEAENAWAIDLNPKKGSSILGARSPAASAPSPAPVEAPAPVAEPPAAPANLRLTDVPAPEEAQPAPRTPIPPPVMAAVLPPAPARLRAPAPPPSSTPFLLGPLVALNNLFDGVLGLTGPLGRFWCGRVGRNLLGTAGLMLLAASVAWGVLDFNDWFGWTW